MTTFNDRITTLESEVSRSLDPASSVDALRKIEADLELAFSTTSRWISQDLLSEPITYSKNLGNLVLLESRLQNLREGLRTRGVTVEDNSHLQSLAEELNLHHVRVSELAAPLASLQRRCFRKDSPLRRIAALRRLRREAPREQRYLHEQTAIESNFAAWLEDDERTDEDFLAASSFFETYRPQTEPLITAEKMARERSLASRRRVATTKAEALIEDLSASEDPSDTSALEVAIRLLTEGLEKDLLLESPKWTFELQVLEARLSKIQAERTRQVQASLALAALERALDERKHGKAVEKAYADARKLEGDLGTDLETRVRRRLELEGQVRFRKVSALTLVGCALIAVGTAIAIFFIQEDRREQLALVLVQNARERIAANTPLEVGPLLETALQADPSLESDPRVISLRVDADAAVRKQEKTRATTCAAITEIASSTMNNELDLSSGRIRIQALLTDLAFPEDSVIQACTSDAMQRLDEHEAMLIQRSKQRLALAVTQASSVLQDAIDTWPEHRSHSARVDPDAWTQTLASLDLASLNLGSTLDASPSIDALRPNQEDAADVRRELTERASEARERILALREGFAAMKRMSNPVRDEQAFLDSLKNAAIEHAGFLQLIGRYREVERSLEIAESLPSLKTWRDDFVSDVLDGSPNSSTVSAKSKSLDRIKEFQRRFPRSPLNHHLEEFRSFLKLDGILEEQRGDAIAEALDETGLDDLRRMMTIDGWLYARPKSSRSLLYYISTIGDLTEHPDALSTAPPSQYTVAPRPIRSEASAAMAQGMARIRKASGLEASNQLLNLIASVRSADDPDWHLKLAILDAAWFLWIERFGELDSIYTSDVRKWLTLLHRENRSVIMTDWVSDSPERQKRPGSARDARVLARESPDPGRILRAMTKSRLRNLDQLQPALLVGILLPTSSARTPREIRWLDDIVVEEELLVPIMMPDGPTLVEAVIDAGGRLEPPDGLVTEAVPLFRRGKLRENPK